MSAEGSVTRWIRGVRVGTEADAQALWERYCNRLVRLARRKLRGAPRRAADEEDVALSAFAGFCRAARSGRYPKLKDRNDLWRLLVSITAHKATDLIRHETRQTRGGGKVRGDSALTRATGSGQDSDLAGLMSNAPTPEFAAIMAEQCQRLLEGLKGDPCLEVAIYKMEGYTSKEIAQKLGCVERTVERSLNLIRKRWEQELVR